jgi:hypothetical protein
VFWIPFEGLPIFGAGIFIFTGHIHREDELLNTI